MNWILGLQTHTACYDSHILQYSWLIRELFFDKVWLHSMCQTTLTIYCIILAVSDRSLHTFTSIYSTLTGHTDIQRESTDNPQLNLLQDQYWNYPPAQAAAGQTDRNHLKGHGNRHTNSIPLGNSIDPPRYWFLKCTSVKPTPYLWMHIPLQHCNNHSVLGFMSCTTWPFWSRCVTGDEFESVHLTCYFTSLPPFWPEIIEPLTSANQLTLLLAIISLLLW